MMILLFIFLFLLTVWYYYRTPKNLHPIEAACLYMIGFLYGHDWLVIASVNLRNWKMTDDFSMDLLLILSRSFWYPLLLVLFLEKYFALDYFIKRISLFVFWVAIMLFFEYVHDWMGLVQHKHWHLSWSILLWTILGFVLD